MSSNFAHLNEMLRLNLEFPSADSWLTNYIKYGNQNPVTDEIVLFHNLQQNKNQSKQNSANLGVLMR